MEIIRLKENKQSSGGDMSTQVRQLESENADIQFLSKQKDSKIAQLEKSNAEMRQKLQ